MSVLSRFRASGRVFPGRFAAPALVVAACVGAASFAQRCLRAADTSDKDKQVEFQKDVQPIFKESCVKCHSLDNPRKRAAGNLRLDDKAAALKGGKVGKDIVPGSAKDSLVYNVLLGPVKHGGEQTSAMPKARKGEEFKPIPQDQIDTIKAWIDQGAK